MEYRKLNNNTEIPVVGYGVYQTPPSKTMQLVLEALDNGYRHIDTAQNYANEHEVGKAIKASGVNREEVFVTTKTQTNGYANTIKGIDKSLDEFGFDYFDLILIHWPNGDDIDTYHALEDAYDDGKARAIGLSNYNSRQFNEILESCSIKPAVCQIETHILWQQQKMHEYLLEKDCMHMAWSPFASGYMDIFNNQLLRDIAESHEKSVGQVMLKYLLQQDITPIPKSTNVGRMKENIDIFDFKLSRDELNQIRGLDQRKSYCNWPSAMKEESNY